MPYSRKATRATRWMRASWPTCYARVCCDRSDYHEGRKPYGERPGEEATIKRICEMRASGLAYDTIAERLNAEGIPARAGRWHATSIRRIVARQLAATQ